MQEQVDCLSVRETRSSAVVDRIDAKQVDVVGLPDEGYERRNDPRIPLLRRVDIREAPGQKLVVEGACSHARTLAYDSHAAHEICAHDKVRPMIPPAGVLIWTPQLGDCRAQEHCR